VCELREKFAVSERRACEVLNQPRGTQRYKSQPRDDEEGLVKRMRELAGQRPRFGYRRIAALLRRERWRASATRVLRLWRREGLRVPQKRRKKRAIGVDRHACHVARAACANDVWCWDFVFDRTQAGSPLKWLSIVDEYTRECVALQVARDITAEDVIDALAELFALRGAPRAIRSDNGPEFVAHEVQRWLRQVDVQTRYVAPGSPWQNGYAESFHSRLRDEFLAREVFESLAAARKLTAAWREDYNHVRPHGSLGYLTPAEFAVRGAPSAPAGGGLRCGGAADLPQHRARNLKPNPTGTFITPGTRI
jgi:putative transposase